MRFSTTSKIGVGNSPGGRPTSTQVPGLRVIAMPCLNAVSDGAVISTPCAPPLVAFFNVSAGLLLAARKVCDLQPGNGLKLAERTKAVECFNEALADAVQRINRPMLTSVHESSARDLG